MEKIAILASGSMTGGGSGFEKLVEATRRGDLQAEIACVISNHLSGGVQKRADKLDIRFLHFKPPFTADRLNMLIGENVELICFSGWLKKIIGLGTADSRKTINIHPGPLPEFGGEGMYGRYVHEAVMEAYYRGDLTHSAVTMHFVTDEYDKGPVFLHVPVEIKEDDTPESLGARVNAVEHEYQWRFTEYVLSGRISWDGKDPKTLVTV